MSQDGAVTRARRWLDDVAGALDADADALDGSAALAVLADLEQRHGEPQRHYHTIVHVDAVLAVLDELDADNDERDPDERGIDERGRARPRDPSPDRAPALAAWFHDAIYDPTSAGNEAASAELARAQLVPLGVALPVVDEVARLIEMTAGHVVAPGDRAAARLADADLAILGAPPDVYDAYAEQIRREYHHVPADAYRVGRADILARFLERTRIYNTRAGRRRWEPTARANLERERRALLEPTG
jgi:predicted metal-dependent HD superfamily phosphohydrolase